MELTQVTNPNRKNRVPMMSMETRVSLSLRDPACITAVVFFVLRDMLLWLKDRNILNLLNCVRTRNLLKKIDFGYTNIKTFSNYRI